MEELRPRQKKEVAFEERREGGSSRGWFVRRRFVRGGARVAGVSESESKRKGFLLRRGCEGSVMDWPEMEVGIVEVCE